MQFIEDEPENEAFEFFLERELDFSTYDTKNKCEFDFEKVTGYEKPKLNRNNIQFHSYFHRFIFDAIPIADGGGLRGEFISPLNDIQDLLNGEDSNYSEQQDSEPIPEFNDDRLHISDSTDRGEKEAQSSHSSD
jgi:hypothetical protein